MYVIAQASCMVEGCVVKQLKNLQIDWPAYIEGVHEMSSAFLKSVRHAMISVFTIFRWRQVASIVILQVFWYVFV